MLKKRIIPVVLYRGETVVKGTKFGSWRSIGHVRQAVEVFSSRGVDELLLLDIGATPEGREPDFNLIRDLTEKCFFPVTVGGGIRTVDHFQRALASGADKVCICTAAIESPELITEASHRFGSQAVVVCIDYCEDKIYLRSGTKMLDAKVGPYELSRLSEAWGAGEIILSSVLRDGVMENYDLKTISEVSAAVRIPVVACGGCGSYQHMADAFDAGTDAVAAGALWVWEDATPAEAAEYLHSRGYPVRRLDTEERI